MPKKIAAGNWKMNGVKASLAELQSLSEAFPSCGVDIVICPPATLISNAVNVAGSVQIGGQDCHANATGAHTGDTSADMLADAGASHVIVGHSERRTDHGESNSDVAAKAEAGWKAGLISVICIGETLSERESGETNQVLAAQLTGSVPAGATAANTVIAYEPVWAIGTGKIPSFDEITDAHAFIRAHLGGQIDPSEAAEISLLYGGSVKPNNASEIFALGNVDGALVGGASLLAKDFSAIISALEAA